MRRVPQSIEGVALLAHRAEHTALLVDEVGGRVKLNNLARVEDKDAIAVDDGVQPAPVRSGVTVVCGSDVPVRDDEHDTVLEALANGLLNPTKRSAMSTGSRPQRRTSCQLQSQQTQCSRPRQ